MVPVEFKHALPVALGDRLLVKDSIDVVNKTKWLSSLSQAERKSLVDEQEAALRAVIDPRPQTRVELLEHVASGGKL